MFRKVILNGIFVNGAFIIQDVNKVILDIPVDFKKAMWGYGHWYGRFYGHT